MTCTHSCAHAHRHTQTKLQPTLAMTPPPLQLCLYTCTAFTTATAPIQAAPTSPALPTTPGAQTSSTELPGHHAPAPMAAQANLAPPTGRTHQRTVPLNSREPLGGIRTHVGHRLPPTSATPHHHPHRPLHHAVPPPSLQAFPSLHCPPPSQTQPPPTHAQQAPQATTGPPHVPCVRRPLAW
jgi:hypothetical protein